jgi:2-dehydropantoate 2-reductase
VEVTVHADAIHIGSLYGEDPAAVAPLCAAIAAGDIPCEAVPDIAKDLWAKMLFNCPLNSLGAILSVSYGALGESAQARHLMDEIVREVFQVMEAAGYSTHWASPQAYLSRFYEALIPLTADHYPSTLQDLQAGKRTEIDALNGAIVTLGQANGISVPVNETMYHLIKFLEARS